ncbi:unnamed protein product [Microthlaspi erraticum]|uniref:Uncharacterized protein n=1 Tax=Microthlaspi erraticum TaxID=1685480 RepID=A0A6D2IIY0_9BRAS|nr:unnamed protein product [Microthlaspi erraticum]
MESARRDDESDGCEFCLIFKKPLVGATLFRMTLTKMTSWEVTESTKCLVPSSAVRAAIKVKRSVIICFTSSGRAAR